MRLKVFVVMIIVGLACIDYVATNTARSIPIWIADASDWWRWHKLGG